MKQEMQRDAKPAVHDDNERHPLRRDPPRVVSRTKPPKRRPQAARDL